MTWIAVAAELSTVLTAIMAATWFIIRQNSKIAAGVLAIKENDLRHLHEKLDAVHVDVKSTAEKLDRHLEWHINHTS